MAKATLTFLLAGLLAGCSAEPPAAGSKAAGGGAQTASKAGPAMPTPKLARLKASIGGDAAAYTGTLQVVGQCIFAVSGGEQVLIATATKDARWDAAAAVLVVGEKRIGVGQQIFLGGSMASAAALAGQWIDPPPEDCATSRIWVASTIRGR